METRVLSKKQYEKELSRLQLELVLLQEDFDLARSFGVNGMPAAVLIGRDGRIAAEPVHGTDPVADLLDATAPVRPAATLEVTMGGRR